MDETELRVAIQRDLRDYSCANILYRDLSPQQHQGSNYSLDRRAVFRSDAAQVEVEVDSVFTSVMLAAQKH